MTQESDRGLRDLHREEVSMWEILVVEDDARQRAEIEVALLLAGHRVDLASGGNEAVEKLKAKRFDLVVTDLLMDQGTGFEVLAWVAGNAPGLPVMICSS